MFGGNFSNVHMTPEDLDAAVRKPMPMTNAKPLFAVAVHRNTSPTTLAYIAKMTYAAEQRGESLKAVYEALCWNPNTPFETLVSIGDTAPSDYIRKIAAEEIERRGLLEILSDD